MQFDENLADDEWEWYIGKLYTQILINCFSGNLNTVVELAPGFRYKIAYALKDVDFCGELYVIDENENVINYVKNKYQGILPNAKIITINKKFEDSFLDLPNNIDLFLSNHSIDDMIISKYLENNKFENSNSYKDLILDAWDCLDKNSQEKENVINFVYETFNSFFKSKNIKFVVLGQYQSNLYFKDSVSPMNKITNVCFEKIKSHVETDDNNLNNVLKYYPFGNDERYLGMELLNNTQNAKNWIVGKITKK